MTYKIPLFDLNYDTSEEEAVLEVIRSKWISTGPKTAEFENTFAEMLHIKYGVAMASCTAALHLALKILDVKEGDEVICPSLTFVATVNAIKYVGATPVFADIRNVDDLTIDPIHIQQLITPRTKVIIVMHYGGFPCAMEAILKIALKHNIRIVEDACHGPLSNYGNDKLGTLGDIGCFSFFANKNISTGEGGMLVTNSEKYAEHARLLRSHGMTSLSYERAKGHSTSYDVIDLGYNYRMDDIRSAIGLVQLKKIKTDMLRRQEIRASYIKELCAIENIGIPFKDHHEFVSNYIFPVVLKKSNAVNRDRIRNSLHQQGIQTSIHYPAVHRFSIYRGKYALQNTEYVADNEITLPMHSKLTKTNITKIANALKEIV
jgi:dTDP-4-amino-4,6-dideoxygalactose transaminase